MVNKRKQGLTQARAKLTSHRMRSATVGTHVPRRSSRHMNGEAVGFSSPAQKGSARLAASWKLFCPSHRRARARRNTPVASAVANSPRTSNVRRASAASSRSRSACSWRLPSPPPSAWRRSSGRSMRSSGSRIPMQRRRSLLPRADAKAVLHGGVGRPRCAGLGECDGRPRTPSRWCASTRRPAPSPSSRFRLRCRYR